MPSNEMKTRFLIHEANTSEVSFPFGFAILNQIFNQHVPSSSRLLNWTLFWWSTPFGYSQFPKATKIRLRFSIKGLHFQMCEILQILISSSIRRGEEIGMIGFKWLGIWEEKGLKIENYRLEFGIKDFSN